MTTTTFHDQTYEYYPWAQLGEDVFKLAQNVAKSGKKFDRLIALAKGGLTFSRSLVDYLDIPEVSSLQIEFYTGIGETAKTPVITQSLPVTVRNERVLIFDDIVDTGETLKLAVQYLKYHGASEISTATLVSKPWTTFSADFSVRDTKAWVIFPHETRETIQLLGQMWAKKGDSPEKVSKQLLEIGFSKPEVALFHPVK